MLNLTYRFGKQDASLFQRKKSQRQQVPQDALDQVDV
jgi:hypothetical protein